MKSKSFELSDLNEYRLFYKLNKFSGFDQFEIYINKIQGQEVFEDCIVLNLYGDLVVALTDQLNYSRFHNLVATDGVKSEIINLHPFERMWKFYKLGHNNDNQDSFGFYNSVPAIYEAYDWRCDQGLFDPVLFVDALGNTAIPFPENLGEIVVYEPFMSVNGIGHILFTEVQETSHCEDMLNNSYMPTTSLTLGGVFKLITEWADMANEPFNNTEDIAIKANLICEQLGITKDLVDNQPDMQIYKYIQGDASARTAPTPVMFSEKLDSFIKKNMAHSSLSSILTIYPEIQIDLNTVLDIELKLVDKDVIDFLSPVIKDESIDLFNRQQVLEYLDTNARRPDLPAFARFKLSFLDLKKELLLNIKESGVL